MNLELFITEDRISFETSKLLKQKGFHWYNPLNPSSNGIKLCSEVRNYCFNDEGKEITPKYYNRQHNHYPRPTQSLLAKWLRINANVNVLVYINSVIDRKTYSWSIVIPKPIGKIGCDEYFATEHFQFDTYYDCLENGLQKALSLIQDDENKIVLNYVNIESSICKTDK